MQARKPITKEFIDYLEDNFKKEDKEGNQVHCGISLCLPLIPYTNPYGQRYELGSLLHYLFNNNEIDPLTHKPLKPHEIGSSKMRLDRELIDEIDAFLAQHNYTRKDLLDYYKMPEKLYYFLTSNKITAFLKYLSTQKKSAWQSLYLSLGETYPLVTSMLIPIAALWVATYVFQQSYLPYYSQNYTPITQSIYTLVENSFNTTAYYKTIDYQDQNVVVSRAASKFCNALLSPASADFYSSNNQLATCFNMNTNPGEFKHNFLQSARALRIATTAIITPIVLYSLPKKEPIPRLWQYAHPLLLLLFGLGMLAIGFDGLTGLLGLVKYFTNAENLIAQYACHTACNFYKLEYNNITYLQTSYSNFNHCPTSYSTVKNTTHFVSESITASLFHLTMAACAFFSFKRSIAHLSKPAIQHREMETLINKDSFLYTEMKNGPQ